MRHLVKLAGAGLATLMLMSGSAGAVEVKDVLTNYADIAQAAYEDSLNAARSLNETVKQFIATPTQENLNKAREAWIAARVPYQQTEVFRFGNPIVDEWEGKVNAWPLDEGLIDYVDQATYGSESDENPLYTANIIANKTITVGGETVDASTITPELLEQLQEAGDIETNVTTGYHAIEFLLWGQDRNSTGPGAGDRPPTDFDMANCTNGNCDRRAAYLQAATDLLVKDLSDMADAWKPEGDARKAVLDGTPEDGLRAMLVGMGSLSYGELAGERMKLGLLLHDPEEEHDCFSDNTPASHYYDVLGIENVYLGRYKRIDDSEVKGASLSELVAAKSPAVDEDLKAKLSVTLAAMKAIVERAKSGEHYDQMLAADNAQGNAVIEAAITALLNQTRSIEAAVETLGLKDVGFEGSESLDNPEAVLQ
ncbi:imelysin family protein [Rhodoligotrophos defluvii]|uniref:imelysin family protein n=1 Tax=Rhodoligotrophos defluvii TaxID=2561934 RepID=UPI0010C9B455